MKSKKGFSVVEVLLAAALFVIFAAGTSGVAIQALNTNRLSREQIIASQYASEGIEAVYSIKKQNFNNLINSAGTGVVLSGGTWIFSGSTNTIVHNETDNYVRTIAISDVNRDISGNIVEVGGTLDPNSKKITTAVSWNYNLARNNSVIYKTYLSNWKQKKSGMLVYGNGGTTSDSVMYKTFDSSGWSSASPVADIDSGSTNKYLRAGKLYSSQTRNEKILVSRHYNGSGGGSNQSIYAQVFNGTSWGNVILLSSWTSTNYLDVQNFDGTYLANGDFMVVYSNNSNTPQFRIWNGSTWSGSSIAMRSIGGIPNYIVAKARPNTNEVMTVYFDQSSDTNSQYFNGGSYTIGSWTLSSEHATQAPTNTKRFVDFDWSANNSLKGAMVYSRSSNDKAINIKIWTADGSGGGVWSSTANTSNQGSNIGALSIAGRFGADEFIACDKDAATSPSIICYETNFTPSWTNPANQTIVTGSDTGIQRSYHIAYESLSGNQGLIVYSDASNIPKFKKYDAASNSWDASPNSINTSTYTLNGTKTVRLIPQSGVDDIMILITDANRNLYSVLWDGINNNVYTTPSSFAFTQHGTNGSAITDFWYDFIWD